MGHSQHWDENTLCHYHEHHIPEGATEEFKCKVYASGRYVSVSKSGNLAICEVVVHGYVAGNDTKHGPLLIKYMNVLICLRVLIPQVSMSKYI